MVEEAVRNDVGVRYSVHMWNHSFYASVSHLVMYTTEKFYICVLCFTDYLNFVENKRFF